MDITSSKKALVQELETYFPERDRSEEEVYKVEDNQEIDNYWDIEDYTPSRSFVRVKSVSGIPAGLQYTLVDGRITLKATGKAVVETKKTLLLKGKVTSTSGKPIYDAKVKAIPQSYSDVSISDNVYTDRNGNYEIQVLAGTYNMYAEMNDVYSYANDKKITANTTQNFKINLFVVNLKSSDTSFDPKRFKTWYKKGTEDQVGFSNNLYLKTGTYDIESDGTAFPGFKYEASAKFTVKGDMTVTATVTGTSLPVGTVSEGTTTMTATDEDAYFKFVPTSTAVYRFYSSNSTGDPLLEVYNEDGDSLAYNDDSDESLDFDLTVNLTKGKTYYLRYYDYDGAGEKMDIHINPIS